MNQPVNAQVMSNIVGATLAVALEKQNQPVNAQDLTNIVGATLAVALVTPTNIVGATLAVALALGRPGNADKQTAP